MKPGESAPSCEPTLLGRLELWDGLNEMQFDHTTWEGVTEETRGGRVEWCYTSSSSGHKFKSQQQQKTSIARLSSHPVNVLYQYRYYILYNYKTYTYTVMENPIKNRFTILTNLQKNRLKIKQSF